MRGPPRWPDVMIEELGRLYADPSLKSAAVIADDLNRKFGTQLTRNGVIGRVNRMGLKRDGRATSRPERPHPKHKPVAHQRPPQPQPAPIPETPPIGPGVPFSELEPGDCRCRYEVGGGHDAMRYVFCGAATDGGPFCDFHHGMVYVRGTANRMPAVPWLNGGGR